MSHYPEDWCEIWRKTDLLFQKWQEFGEFWLEHSKVSKMCTFIGSCCAKYLMFELKKYRGVTLPSFMTLKSDAKSEEKLTWKWHEEYGKFSPEHLEVSKLGLWWDPFVQSRKVMTLKFTEELCVMAMKNNAKFEEELTCHFKTDMRNFTNFDSTWKSKKIAL